MGALVYTHTDVLCELQGKDLRTDFQSSMESYLGVMKSESPYSRDGAALNDRTESNTADQLDYETDPATKSYVQTYYEMVEEGKVNSFYCVSLLIYLRVCAMQIPILSTKVQNARQTALRAADERATEAAKRAASGIQVFTPITPNRPRFVFEDVHMRYAHTIDNKSRRGADAERRRRTREEKMVEKTIDVMKRREERAKEAQKIARRRMMEERMRAAKALKTLKVNLNAAKASPSRPAV